jgi:hypothetical protein
MHRFFSALALAVSLGANAMPLPEGQDFQTIGVCVYPMNLTVSSECTLNSDTNCKVGWSQAGSPPGTDGVIAIFVYERAKIWNYTLGTHSTFDPITPWTGVEALDFLGINPWNCTSTGHSGWRL